MRKSRALSQLPVGEDHRIGPREASDKERQSTGPGECQSSPSDPHKCWKIRRRWKNRSRGFLHQRWTEAALLLWNIKWVMNKSSFICSLIDIYSGIPISTHRREPVQSRLGDLLPRADTFPRRSRGGTVHQKVSRRAHDRVEEGQGLQQIRGGEFDSLGTPDTELVSGKQKLIILFSIENFLSFPAHLDLSA